MKMRTLLFAMAWACASSSSVRAGTDAPLPLSAPVRVADTDNGTIGVYADPAGTMPCLDVPRGEGREFHILATLAGAGAGGLAGAEFRIEVSNPSGYSFTYAPPPAATIVLGNPLDLTPEDPFDNKGANVAFPFCQWQGPVSLGTLLVVNLQGGPTQILVKRKSIPSNPSFNCAHFNQCDIPSFTKVCYTQCAIDDNGEPITFRTTLNDSSCTGMQPCPEACPGKPCVDIAIAFRTTVCRDRGGQFTATVTNCSPDAQDLDVLMNYELVESFADVPAGQTFTVSRTFSPQCGVDVMRFPVAVLARNDACPVIVGREAMTDVLCVDCPGSPPDCSHAAPTIAVLSPTNHQLVTVGITGVTDPDGDPVVTRIIAVRSDEPVDAAGSGDGATCPDAVLAPDERSVQLRAERLGAGNGRIYTLYYTAHDPGGLACAGTVQVCVPRKPNGTCVLDPGGSDPTVCPAESLLSELAPTFSGPLVVTRTPSGIDVRFAPAEAGDAVVELYDLRGRLVRRLEEPARGAGELSVSWDGRDSQGRDVAQGIYLVRARLHERVWQTKVLWTR